MALVLAAGALVAGVGDGAAASVTRGTEADVAAARALFERNLDAIRHRDRDAYLACYLESASLARTGPTGFTLGYEELERSAGSGWPDVFEASNLELVGVRPGVVYGTYRYRVRFGAIEQSGLSERVFVETPRGWRIAVSTAFVAPAATPAPPRALVGATLVDGTGAPPIADAVVVMRDGKIECAGAREDCELPAGLETIDLAGSWITPGVVDAHVHFSQTGWADGRPDALDVREVYPYERTIERLRSDPDRWFRCYLCSGVTAVFDVGGYPWTIGLEDRSEADTRAPHVAAAGPLISTLDHWLNLKGERQFIHLADEQAARDGVRYLASLGGSAVKVWFIQRPGDSLALLEQRLAIVGEEARRANLPLIVHATELAGAKAALRAGARLLVHSVWDQEVDDEFIALMRAKGSLYCPTLIVSDGYARMFDAVRSGRPPKIDDPNGCVDSLTRALVERTPEAGTDKAPPHTPERERRDRERAGWMRMNLAKVHAAGIPIAMGTDAGNPLTLHGPSVYAEMEAMQEAGMSPAEVLVASTRGGALAMGRVDDFGTLEAGKSADLLVIGGDPTRDIANMRKLRYVVRGGVLRSLGELRERLRE